MDITLKLPDDIVERLQAHWKDLPRRAVESLAIESYKAGVLTSYEVQRMLGLSSRWATDEFLKKAGAYLDYTEEDLKQDIETFRRLSAR
ncbi:MAG TPA: UPF0175 family protein [Thermoanaerobaculia bacterium]